MLLTSLHNPQEELGSRKRPPPVTVARRFTAEVDALIVDLQRTHTSFIRMPHWARTPD